MQKVYAITRGGYSDYHIEKIFSTREAAEKYCAVDTNKYDEPMIEEYYLENGSDIQIDRMYKAIFFQVIPVGTHRYGTVDRVISSMTYGLSPFPTDIQENRKVEKRYGDGIVTYGGISGWIPVTETPAPHDEKIEKMIRDRVAKWKAEQNDLC